MYRIRTSRRPSGGKYWLSEGMVDTPLTETDLRSALRKYVDRYGRTDHEMTLVVMQLLGAQMRFVLHQEEYDLLFVKHKRK